MFSLNARRTRILVVSITVLVLCLFFVTACDTGRGPVVPIGTWSGPSEEFPDSYTLTTTTLSYTSGFGDREATVVSVTLGSLNAGDTALGSNVDETGTVEPGYAVIEYTSPAAIAGTFNVFRFGNVDGSPNQQYMAEGFAGFDVGQFSSAEAALAGVTTDGGSFFLGIYTKQ